MFGRLHAPQVLSSVLSPISGTVKMAVLLTRAPLITPPLALCYALTL